MERLTKAINVLNSIANAIQNSSNSNAPALMPGMLVKVTDEKVLAVVESIYDKIKQSCRSLITGMTDDEKNRLNISDIIYIFNDEIKKVAILAIENNSNSNTNKGESDVKSDAN